MTDNVDYTFIPRRRAQIYVEITKQFGPAIAAVWVKEFVPKKDQKDMTIYLKKELEKYDPTH